MFFVPIFPISSKTEYVECDKCLATFSSDTTAAKPPSREDYFFNDCMAGLSQGWALETVKEDLVKAGYTVEFAEKWLETTVGGDVCECEPCGLHYLKGTARCLKCGRKPK